MLVDAGADVNARHGRTSLTPLLMACNQAHPDVETIRSFLDKGAYPNWRDVQGRTAFSLIMNSQSASRSRGGRMGLEDGGWSTNERESVVRESIQGNRWRDMDDTIEEVRLSSAYHRIFCRGKCRLDLFVIILFCALMGPGR